MSDYASNIIHRQKDTELRAAAADDRQAREAATQRRTETGEIARLSPHNRPEAPLTSTDAIHRSEPGPPRRPLRTDRIAVIAGSALLLVGAVAAVAVGLQEAAGGYVGSGTASFTTPTAAFTTSEIDVRGNTARAADPVNDLGDLAQVRIAIRSPDPDVEIFAGVAPTADIRSYLRRVAHDTFDSATLEPFEATFRRSTGTSPPDDPQDQTFWVASSSGQGELTLDWDKRQGAWSLLIMRADGSAGLDLEASIALRFAFLTPVAIGALSAGALTITGTAIARARRRNRADTQTAPAARTYVRSTGQ